MITDARDIVVNTRPSPEMTVRAALEAAVGQVEHIDVSRFPMPMRLWAEADPLTGGVRIHVTARVKERDTGATTKIQMTREVSAEACLAGHTLVFVRAMLREAVLHELDECLLVDGKRVWDPHRNEAR